MEIKKDPKKALADAKHVMIQALDADGDGEISIGDMITLGLRVPGVQIDRANFLQKELMKNYPQEVIDEAIRYTPMHAKIDPDEIDKIADEVIKFERYGVSGIATALNAPGIAYLPVTLPTDLAQNYGFMLRAAQKLLYLYGFPQLDLAEPGQKLDSETMNILIVCLGTMYGVTGANAVIGKMAVMLGQGIEKKLVQKALMKTVFYPILKKVSAWFSVKMTKALFASIAGKSVPIVGAFIGGGLTYATFKPCCDRLKESLQSTMLADPDYTVTEEDKEMLASIYEVDELEDD